MLTVSSNQDDMTTAEQSTSFSGISIYSRYWIAYVSVPLPRSTTDDYQCNSPTADDRSSSVSTDDKRDSSPNQLSNQRESISSPDQSPDRRQSSVSSHDQRLSPLPFDYGEMMTYPANPSQADKASLPSSDNDPRVNDDDSRISSWRPLSLDDKNDKDRGLPMILFDEHGDMHRNYYASFSSLLKNTNDNHNSDEAEAA